MSEEAMHRQAVRRVKAKLGFRSHLVVFVLVNAGLAVINLLTSPGYLWFVFPLGGWGIGLFAHGLAVYGHTSTLYDDMVAREQERLRQSQASRR